MDGADELNTLGILGCLYSYYDAANQTSEYNENLYKEIFGKEPPK